MNKRCNSHTFFFIFSFSSCRHYNRYSPPPLTHHAHSIGMEALLRLRPGRVRLRLCVRLHCAVLHRFQVRARKYNGCCCCLHVCFLGAVASTSNNVMINPSQSFIHPLTNCHPLSPTRCVASRRLPPPATAPTSSQGLGSGWSQPLHRCSSSPPPSSPLTGKCVCV